MNRHLHVAGADEVTLVELGRFSRSRGLTESWSSVLRPDMEFFGDRYWKFTQDPEAKAARAVGSIMCDFIDRYVEFEGLRVNRPAGFRGQSESEAAVSLLGITAWLGRNALNPDNTVANLVQATNESLEALRSQYRLPLEK